MAPNTAASTLAAPTLGATRIAKWRPLDGPDLSGSSRLTAGGDTHAGMPDSWTVAEPSLPALTCTYSFGPGLANALAFVVDGGVVVVSPPSRPTEGTFAELEKHGPVRALIAPNSFHHLGLPAWKARYPDAPIFAPAQSIARIEKQSKLSGLRPVAEAAKLVGDRVELLDMPHYRTGEILIRWRVDGGWAWYVTDVAMNITSPLKGLFGLVFRLTKSTPGFRRNAVGGTFMVKDKRALYAWIAEQAEKTPPRLLVMCHGAPVRPTDPPAEIRAALA